MRLATDANVLLSVAFDGRSSQVLRHVDVGIATTSHTFEEVLKYVPVMAEKRRKPLNRTLKTLGDLPIAVFQRDAYSEFLPEATRRIGHRDPKDADLLALALAFDIPIWSNDRDFEIAGVELYTTEDMLKLLKII